jgi:hypothetical protein
MPITDLFTKKLTWGRHLMDVIENESAKGGRKCGITVGVYEKVCQSEGLLTRFTDYLLVMPSEYRKWVRNRY